MNVIPEWRRLVIPPFRTSYSTTFPLTEPILNEGGNWISAGCAGFQDCSTTPGFAYGAGPSPSPPYNDPIACLTGPWDRVQTAICTLKIVSIPVDGVNREVELYLHAEIDGARGQARGYQFLHAVGNGLTYFGIYKNNGPNGSSGDFPAIVEGNGAVLADATRLMFTSTTAGLLTASKWNGSTWVQICQGTDTSYTKGAPGFGFFQHAGPAGPLSGWGITTFDALSQAA